MKTTSNLLGIAVSLAAVASLQAQNTAVTKPVGYHTESLFEGFNVIGANVGKAVSAAGDFEGPGATDTDVDFTALLTGGTAYAVQNTTTGDVASVSSWTATELTTTPALTVTAGDKYEIRAEQTIADLFGANNESGLLEGDEGTADVVWVPDGTGLYERVYRNNVTSTDPFNPLTPGWRSIGGGNTDSASVVVPFNFAVFLQRRSATALSLVFVGHVRGTTDTNTGGAASTRVSLFQGFNVVNRVLPVGIGAADAGVANMLTPGDESTGDVLWNPAGNGLYTRIYNNNVTSTDPFNPLTPGLRTIGGGNTPADSVSLESGFLVQRRAAAGIVAIDVPSGLDL